MNDSYLLPPNNGLPRLPIFPQNGRLEWLEFTDDSYENYAKNGGHPLYGPRDIEYRFNSLGYRCPEFAVTSGVRVIALGCSYVMGVGLPAQALFHERFSERLRTATGRSVTTWNLGLCGASNDYITRLLFLAVPILKPHIVLIHFTHPERRDYVSVQKRWMPYVPAYEPKDFVAREVGSHFAALSSPFDDALNLFRNYKAVETLLSDRPCWLFSSVRLSDFAMIESHVDFKRYAGEMEAVDKARDWCHPGPQSHDLLAEKYWAQFCSSGALGVLAGMSVEPTAT